MVNKFSNHFKKLSADYLILFVLQLSGVLLPFFITPHLFKVLNRDLFGIAMFLMTLTQVFVLIVDFGFSVYAPPEVVKRKDNLSELKIFFSSAYWGRMLVLIIVYFIYFIFSLFSVSNLNIFISYQLFFLFVVGQFLFPIWFFQGMQKMIYITIFGLITKLVSFFGIIFLVNSDADFILLGCIYGLSGLLAGILAHFLINKTFNIKVSFVKFETIFYFMKKSFGFFLSRLGVAYMNFMNPYALLISKSSVEVGLYSIGEKIYSIFQNGYTPLVSALYPLMAKEKNKKLFWTIFYVIVIANCVLCFIVFSYTPEIILFLFKTSDIAVINGTKLLVIAGAFYAPLQLLGYPLLSALSYGREVNLSVIIGCIVHFLYLLVLFFTNQINVINISISIILVNFTILAIRVYYVITKLQSGS